MTRKEAISHIELLFPPDSSQKGEELLNQAKREVNGWRTQPTEVLVRLAQLCREEDRMQAQRFRNSTFNI